MHDFLLVIEPDLFDSVITEDLFNWFVHQYELVCRTIDKTLLEDMNFFQELLDAYFLRNISFDEIVDPLTIVASNADKAAFDFAEEYLFLLLSIS